MIIAGIEISVCKYFIIYHHRWCTLNWLQVELKQEKRSVKFCFIVMILENVRALYCVNSLALHGVFWLLTFELNYIIMPQCGYGNICWWIKMIIQTIYTMILNCIVIPGSGLQLTKCSIQNINITFARLGSSFKWWTFDLSHFVSGWTAKDKQNSSYQTDDKCCWRIIMAVMVDVIQGWNHLLRTICFMFISNILTLILRSVSVYVWIKVDW